MRAKIFISTLALLVGLGAAAKAVAVEKSVLEQLQQKVLADARREQQRQVERVRLKPLVFDGKTELEYFSLFSSGSFTMGGIVYSNDGGARSVSRSERARSRRYVKVRGFLLGKTEVTFAQWDMCVASGGCLFRPDDEGWGRGSRPVINVSWADITEQYIPWLNDITGKQYRLPSEAEWEYAVRESTVLDFFRSGRKYAYSWGSGIGKNNANCNSCGSPWDNKKTAPVASFSPSEYYKLYDMHGNVWEWVQDCWNSNYDDAPGDGSALLTGDCSNRVLRGGSWRSHRDNLKSISRVREDYDERSYSVGFRLARTW